jgi:hypothetical protein
MVEIFTKRTELMPADESIEQHTKKRSEEIADVERDRSGPDGLFKGTFPERRGELWMDEADGVLRCPSCGHEHTGGPECSNCGAEFDEDGFGFSDIDDDDDLEDLENLEFDLEAEVDGEFADLHDHHVHHLRQHFLGMGPHVVRFGRPGHHHHHHHIHDDVTDPSITSNSDEEHSDSDEDDSSLQEFVVPDDEEPVRATGRQQNNRAVNRPIITISDDESDEGGAISNRRQGRRNGRPIEISSPVAPSVVTADGSEASDTNSEAEMLRTAGWSPLDQGDDSEADDHLPNPYGITGYFPHTDDERDSDDESDTGTMVGGGDEEDRSRENLSETPTYDRSGYPSLNPYGDIPRRYTSNIGEEADDDDSDAGQSSIMDRDGDTEMSVSPSVSRSSRSVSLSTNGYGYDGEGAELGRGNRGVSVSTDGNGYGYRYGIGENLGLANKIHEVEDDSSDSSVRPPPRRQPRRQSPNARVQQYDPRISMMFAEHQQSLRETQNNPIGLDDWEEEIRRVEHSSRPRRSTSYRMPQARQMDPLRSSRSPSVTRVISSSNRAARQPRQYARRYHS